MELSKTRASTGLLFTDAAARTTSPTEEVDAAFIEVDDLILVPAGSSPPIDGVISEKSSSTSFDESALTGEARPVLKKPGDAVYAGTINAGPAAATVRVTSVVGHSMVDGIADAVRDAMGKKAGIERLADQMTAYFVPIIVAIALLTLAIWLLRGYAGDLPVEWLSDQRQGSWALFAIEFAVAVLVVACPCGARTSCNPFRWPCPRFAQGSASLRLPPSSSASASPLRTVSCPTAAARPSKPILASTP
jgi:cation transport ATPase